MKPSIFTSFDRTIPFETALAMIRHAGFDIVALDGYPKYSGYATPAGREAMIRQLRAHGLTVDSVHAPFPEADHLFALDEDKRAASVGWARVAIDTAAQLDAGVVAVHLLPYNITDPEQERKMIEQGRRSIAELVDYAMPQKVKLALENGQQRPYDRVLELFLAEFGDPVGLCYDTGHANVQGQCFALLEKYADRLQSFHIHDNTGRDTHVLPFEGNIDWTLFRSVVSRLNLSTDLLLEAGVQNSQYKNPVEFLAAAKKCAESLGCS